MAEGEGMSDAVPDPEIDALREEILRAVLPHVPFDGWTMATLSAGARAAGMDPADAVRAFPRGPVEAIAFRSEEHTSELQSLMRLSYAVFRWKQQKRNP